MTSLRFSQVADKGYRASPLALRMPRASGVVDPEPFRAQARGDAPVMQGAMAPCAGIRTFHLPEGHAAPLFDLPGPLLHFVVSGAIEIDTIDAGSVRLSPGDLFLMDADGPRDGAARTIGDCRLVQMRVGTDWPGEKARPAAFSGSERPAGASPNLKRMYKGADDRSRFRDFTALFGADEAQGKLRPVAGLRFLVMAADTFITWHPEVVNNLVLVLSGGLELEVGGDGGAVEVFWPGDVCLAEDRTGEGHIDRMRGEVLVAIVVMEDADLWPMT